MAKAKFDDLMVSNLQRFADGETKDLLAEALAPVGHKTKQGEKRKDNVRVNRPSEPALSSDQVKRPSQMTESDEQDSRLSHMTESGDRDRTLDQGSRPGHLTEPPDKAIRNTHLTRSPDRVTRPSHLTKTSDSDTPSFSKIPKHDVAGSPGQKAVMRYLQTNGDHVTSHTVISKETGIPIKTVQRALDKFVACGVLEKTPWREGRQNGIRVRLIEPVDRATRPSQGTESGGLVTCPSQQAKSSPPYKEKIDRKNLSISLENMSLTWPRLAAAGFGPDQLAQIEANLTETGQSTERVLPSLHHAEWELENGKMLDKDGKPVADPCSWVFRSLARTGYYRRPAGYVSPEEQAAKDAEAEARAVSLARQSADQARFEAWRDSLSPSELKNALQGHPGGSRDAWLKRMWRETCEAGEVSE